MYEWHGCLDAISKIRFTMLRRIKKSRYTEDVPFDLFSAVFQWQWRTLRRLRVIHIHIFTWLFTLDLAALLYWICTFSPTLSAKKICVPLTLDYTLSSIHNSKAARGPHILHRMNQQFRVNERGNLLICYKQRRVDDSTVYAHYHHEAGTHGTLASTIARTLPMSNEESSGFA